MSLAEFYCDDCGKVAEFDAVFIGIDEDGVSMYENLEGVTPEDEKHVTHDLSSPWSGPSTRWLGGEPDTRSAP